MKAVCAILSICCWILMAGAVQGQGNDQDDWTFSAQIQLRSELDARDFSSDTDPLTFTSIRTRLGVARDIGEFGGIFIQAQDSRVLGNEPSTLSNTQNLDVHQAYVKLTSIFGSPLDVQAGRFEMNYGTQRFIGAVGWHFVGRSFDGARLSYNGAFSADLFTVVLVETTPYIGNPNPGLFGNLGEDQSQLLHGLWLGFDLDPDHKLDAFAMLEVDKEQSNGRDNDLNRLTAGTNYFGNFGDFSATLEAAYQSGTQGTGTETEPTETDIAAYLVSLMLQYNAGEVGFGLGVDLLSGTDLTDADENNTFATPFATNHKFYGHMDYFINTVTNTAFLGLTDIYAKVNWKASKKLGLSLTAHNFMSGQESPGGDSDFGQEVDVALKYTVFKGTSVTWGGSIFLPGELMKAIFGGNEDPGLWSYIMVSANL